MAHVDGRLQCLCIYEANYFLMKIIPTKTYFLWDWNRMFCLPLRIRGRNPCEIKDKMYFYYNFFFYISNHFNLNIFSIFILFLFYPTTSIFIYFSHISLLFFSHLHTFPPFISSPPTKQNSYLNIIFFSFLILW